MARSPLDRKIHFDIHASVDDRWTVHSTADSRAQAIDKAKALLATRQVDAVRVTREGGLSKTEDVVFESKGKGRLDPPVTVTPVEEAPACAELEDFYRFEARKTLGRLLRKYLDKQSITAIELLHGPGHLKWLARDEKLVNQAIQSIARVQVRGTDEKPHQRVEHLYQMAGRITERAQTAETVDEFCRLLKAEGLEALTRTIRDTVPEPNREFLVHATLAAYIGETRDWERKLELVLDQAERLGDDTAFAYLDELVAEIFDGATALKELLGYQRDLADSLQTLVRLSAGTYQARKRAGAGLARLNAVRARRDMPVTKGVMLERVGRELGGLKRLSKEGVRSEEEAFRAVLADLVEARVIAGGPGEISEAVTLRAKSVLAIAHANESTAKAIDDVLALLPTSAARFGYLVDLGGTDLGAKNQSLIVDRLAAIVRDLKSATDLVFTGARDADVIAAAAGVRDRLLSTHLPEEWRLRFARKIYNLLVRYTEGLGQQTPDDAGDIDVAGDAGPPPVVPQRRSTDKPGANVQLERKAFAPGEYVFHEGDPGEEAYFIKSGAVEISRRSGDRDIVIAHVKAGSVVGELALIDSQPRMASARALEATVTIIIPQDDLKTRLKRLEAFDPLLRRLMGVMVERMRNHPIIEP